MVFNSASVFAVVTYSAELCQLIACNPERLPAGEALRLLCSAPLLLARRILSLFRSPHSLPSSSSSSHAD